MICSKFDLQLFAEDSADAGNNSADAGNNNADAGNNNADNADADNKGTILGGATPNSKTTDDDNNTGNDSNTTVPDNVQYDFKSIVPTGMQYDDEAAKEFGQIAQKAGLSQEQASSIAQYGMQYMQKGVKAAIEHIAQQQEDWGDQARQELGGQFDKTVQKAAVGINRLAQKIPNLRETLNITGAGNRVEFIRLFAAIGDLVGEDSGHDAAAGGQDKTIYGNTDFSLYK